MTQKKKLKKRAKKVAKKIVAKGRKFRVAILLRTTPTKRYLAHNAIERMYQGKKVDDGKPASVQWWLDKQLDDLIRRGGKQAPKAKKVKTAAPKKAVAITKKAAKKAVKKLVVEKKAGSKKKRKPAAVIMGAKPVVDQGLLAVTSSFADEEMLKEEAREEIAEATAPELPSESESSPAEA